MKPALGIPVLMALISGSCGRDLSSRPVPGSDAPNVLIITLDTLRADVLGCYGDRDGVSPFLDEFAKSAVLFESATTAMATTFPSHSTIFTGLYPRVHGVSWNGERLAPEFTTLAERLDGAGWDTGAFVSYKAMLTDGGLDQGYSVVSDRERARGEHGIRSGRETYELAQGWLEEPRNGPFFAWVHFFDTHTPLPTRPWSDERMSDYAGVFRDGASNEDLVALNRAARLGDGSMPPADMAAFRLLYKAAVLEVDELVGKTVAAAERASGARPLIVILVADHGEMTGDHGMFGHGYVLWEGVLHVPLLIRATGRFEPARVSRRVGLVDLAPTLLELLELPAEPGSPGHSLLPLLRGEIVPDEIYFSEVRATRKDAPARTESLAGFFGSFKVLLDGDKAHWFDLSSSLNEANAMSLDQAPEPIRQTLARMQEFLLKASSGSDASRGQLNPEQRAELAALGYTE